MKISVKNISTSPACCDPARLGFERTDVSGEFSDPERYFKIKMWCFKTCSAGYIGE